MIAEPSVRAGGGRHYHHQYVWASVTEHKVVLTLNMPARHSSSGHLGTVSVPSLQEFW